MNIAQAKQQIEQLQQQIKDLKNAYVSATTSDTKSTMFQGNIKSADELQQKLSQVTSEFNRLNSAMNTSAKPDYTNYQTQLKGINTEAMKLYQTWQKTGLESDKIKFNDKRNEFSKLNSEAEAFSRNMGTAADRVGYLGSLGQKIRSHFNWILAGTLLAAFAAIPASVENIARETEVLGQKLKQNLELAERYKDNQQGLEGDIKHLGEVAATFAVGYGANVKDVMEMMQVLSRRFKSPEELTYYTNLAMVMHKLDFVEPKKAAEDLEAVILSMGLDFHGARQFIDEFSVAVHTARITGTELLSGLQRSGATFHNMNFNTAQAIAMISTLSTVTAKAGANIGASLNSVLINVDFKKAAQALDAYNIKVYEVVDGHTKMRDGAQVWREIAQVFNGLDDNKANEFANAMSGGERKLAA